MTEHSKRSRAGFSIFEMLVVLGVIGLLAAFAVPAFTSMMGGSKIRQAADTLRNQLVLAQQLAVKDNKRIVVHFYRYDDRLVPGTESAFRAFQLLERRATLAPARSSGPTAGDDKLDRQSLPEIDVPIRLPEGIVMIDDPKYSTILDDAEVETMQWSRLPETLSAGRADCLYFEFRPDGSTSLPQTGESAWCVTLVDESELLGSAGGGLPKNFITIQIDPFNGNIRTYEP